MSLLDTAIWWHVYPLGALGAPIRGEHPTEAIHRLPDLEAWLDHVVDLGCSGLLLGPIFASDTHGYDTLDHLTIDPRLGDDADLDHLLAAASERGLAVVLDGVFNHVGRRHPWVERALTEGPQSECAGLVRIDWDENGNQGRNGNQDQNEDGDRYDLQGHFRGVPATWEGHGDLVPLNHDDPRVADAVAAIMRHWLGRGIAGWRLDVAYSVPAWFWRDVLGRVRAEFPAMIVIGEVIHGDYPAIAEAGALDSVTGYELWKAIWSSLRDRNFWELAWALERHDRFSRDVVLQTFVGNHDVDRIADTVGDAGAALALAVLMTTPGMPSIYYGDEEGFRGRKGTGAAADDPVRPPLPATPDLLSPYGNRMLRLHRDLIGLRRRHPWLARARLRVVDKDCTWITYESTGPQGQSVRVEITLDPEPAVRIRADSEEFRWSAALLGGPAISQ